jgi:hypothetical protein
MASRNQLAALAQNPALLQMLMGYMQPNPLNSEYQRQMDAANQANENRYLDILQGYGVLRDRSLGSLQNYGAGQLADVDESYRQQTEASNADLISRGLRSSTIAGAQGSAINDRRLRTRANVQDDIINRQVNTDIGLTQGALGVMERRSDVPPDLNQLIALQQGVGQSGLGNAGFAGNMRVPPSLQPTGQARNVGLPEQGMYNYLRPPASPVQVSPYSQGGNSAAVSGATSPYGSGTVGGNAQVAQINNGLPPILAALLNQMGKPKGPRYTSGPGQTQGFAPIGYREHAWGGVQPISNTEKATTPHIPGPIAGYGPQTPDYQAMQLQLMANQQQLAGQQMMLPYMQQPYGGGSSYYGGGALRLPLRRPQQIQPRPSAMQSPQSRYWKNVSPYDPRMLAPPSYQQMPQYAYA